MEQKKVIAVLGATGAQGGGLARAICDDPGSPFAVRALTRSASTEKARELARRGAEVVEADLADPASIHRAFEGAYGAYCVTFFWDHFSPEREVGEGRLMAEAARAAGLKHVVWSTLEDTRTMVPLNDDRIPTLMGQYKVPHFDGKGEVDAAFRESGIPTTFLLTSFYWDNFIYFGMGPRANPDGSATLALPLGSRRLAGIAAEDIGACAYGIFKRGGALHGKTVGIAGDHLTGDEMARELSRAFARDVRYEAISLEAYRGLGFPGADDLANMFWVYSEFEEHFVASRPVAGTRDLHPALLSFSQWADRYAQAIPLNG